MKKIALFAIYLLGMVLPASAQEFFNLTADEVRIDSVLPSFNHQIALGSNYADSVYEVSIEYPEFIDMSPTDIERYQLLTTDTLPALPVVHQSVAISRKQGSLCISFIPLVMRDGRYQKLVSFKLDIQSRARSMHRAQRASGNAADRYASHSVLASGRWIKISVPATGVYQLTNSLLSQAGFSDPSKVKVYGYGGALQNEVLTEDYLTQTDDLKEVPTCTVNGKRLFFAEGPVSWPLATSKTRVRNFYSSDAYYFLTESEGDPLTVDEATFQQTANEHPYGFHSHIEPEEFSWYQSGRNLYSKSALTLNSASSYTVFAPCNSGTLTVAMSYNGYCDADVAINGTKVGTITVNDSTIAKGVSYFKSSTYSSVASYTWNFEVSALTVGENTVTITQTSNTNTAMRLDFLTLTTSESRGFDLAATDIAVPTILGKITNQDYHAHSAVDMIIIIPTSQKLRAQAERLKTFHEQHDSMTVRIVPADELYNEFSGGTPDGTAYRRYLKMFYDRATTDSEIPRYLLLFGDGAWDNRMLISDWSSTSPDDFLLCYESENSFSQVYSYVSDDFFCMLDDGERIDNYLGKADVAVGRIPARTESEATIAVDKIISYVQNEHAGAWQNLICMMGDDGDENQHMMAADEIAIQIQEEHPSFNIKKIYWDAYTRESSATGSGYPQITRIIRQLMVDGALVMNYNGHGAPAQLSHEAAVTLSDFAAKSSTRYPLWVTASCDIMPFDRQTANIGETALFNKNGGAIAFFGTPRTVFMDKNKTINLAFMEHVLSTDSTGKHISIGEAVRLAKNQLIDERTDRTVNKLNYALLGDPAVCLASPTMSATIDKINGIAVGDSLIQLKASSQVTVEGHIDGDSDFSGVGTILIRDIEETIACKMQASTSVFTYKDRPSTIYTGSDSITKGKFKFTFAIPYDITYSEESGQILVYAVSNDKQRAAHGVNTSFCMNGTKESENTGLGPSIYCYLNDRSFVDGGTVNSTPYFYAELTDNDGINASGNAIGHDIELIIDGEMSKTYILNSYFQYNFGDHRSGTIGYSIPELSEGNHTLLLRAWDILNNSSTAKLSFYVDPKQEPSLINVVCVRDVTNSNTRFLITHNRTGSQMDITLEIFDPSGRTLWRRSETGVPTQNTYAVDWDLNVNGYRLPTGVYLYRILVSSNGSTEATAAQKLIITKQ